MTFSVATVCGFGAVTSSVATVCEACGFGAVTFSAATVCDVCVVWCREPGDGLWYGTQHILWFEPSAL